MDPEGLGLHWVGDLALCCTADVESDKGELVFELRKGGRRFQCRIDVATGRATLSISGPDMEQFRPTAATGVRGPGRHEIRFSNCDNELRLWVDGNVVQFDAPTGYDDLGNTSPDATDLDAGGRGVGRREGADQPPGIFRDIYYGAVRGEGMPRENCDTRYAPGDALAQPARRSPRVQHVDFSLGADQFFALGDNSARARTAGCGGTTTTGSPASC